MNENLDEVKRESKIAPPRSHFFDTLREDVKYYFAGFVREGGTPPPFNGRCTMDLFILYYVEIKGHTTSVLSNRFQL